MEESVRQRIKEILTHYKKTVGGVSKEVKYSQSNLNKQVNGSTAISIKTLEVILDYFPDISAEWLLRGNGPMFKHDIYLNSEDSPPKRPDNEQTDWKAKYEKISEALDKTIESLSRVVEQNQILVKANMEQVQTQITQAANIKTLSENNHSLLNDMECKIIHQINKTDTDLKEQYAAKSDKIISECRTVNLNELKNFELPPADLHR